MTFWIGSLCSLVWGQANVTGGALSGVVRDDSAAVIGNAAVKVKNVETGLTRETTTGEDGTFRLPALPAGVYDVTVSSAGFTELTRRATVLIGQTASVEIVLSTSQVSEAINVTADSSSIVETARTQQSTTVNERAVKDLPVNGRNFLDFIRLTPGINVDPRGGDYSAGGLRGTFNSLLIDGADNNNTFFGQTLGRTGVRAPYQFSQSSVKEFQVNTNSYAAEFGRAGGALVNVITKSGTNEFHGEGFYFFSGIMHSMPTTGSFGPCPAHVTVSLICEFSSLVGLSVDLFAKINCFSFYLRRTKAKRPGCSRTTRSDSNLLLSCCSPGCRPTDNRIPQ